MGGVIWTAALSEGCDAPEAGVEPLAGAMLVDCAGAAVGGVGGAD